MLQFQNVTLGYNRRPAVHHLNVHVPKGDFLALVGPNGAGKSTLLKGILGQVTPMEGSISLESISKQDISYLPQATSVDRQFPMTAEQFVASGLWQELGLFKKLKSQHVDRIHEAIKTVGLSGFAHRPLDALSGGQFQRLLFARKLIQSSKLMLLDEPFNGVDEQTVEDLMAVLKDQHNKGATIIAVIHNMSLVRRYFPKAMLLSRELIGYGDTASVLSADNLVRASTVGFGDNIEAEVCLVHDHD